MKRILAILLISLLFAGDEDLFVTRVPPDVLLIFDTSGSMAFDYNGYNGFWGDWILMRYRGRYYWWPTGDEAGDCTWGDGGGGYNGRFLGYDTNRDGEPNDSRMYMLKNGLSQILRQTRGLIRYGLMRFYQRYYSHGYDADWYAEIEGWWRGYRVFDAWPIPWKGRDNCGRPPQILVDISDTGVDSILTWIDGEGWYRELRADGATPLAKSLQRAFQYYKQRIRDDAWRDCRQYFVLLLTDGLETCGGNPVHWARQLRHTVVLGRTHDIRTYVLGLSLPEEQREHLNDIAEAGGTGHAYFADNPDELAQVLEEITGQIVEAAYSFTAPEVPAVRSRYNDKLYMASFIPTSGAFWKGYLKAYQLRPDGTLPVNAEGKPAEAPIWEAGQRLAEKSPGDRRIYTYLRGEQVPFTSTYVSPEDLGVASEAERDSIIAWIRGGHGVNWKLGDIFHSTPLVIGPPNPYYHEGGYNEFKELHRTRDKILLAGANDGMLHAFDAGEYIASADSFSTGTGDEVWAFIPPSVLTKLKDSRVSHTYLVDGPPVGADVWFPSDENDTTKEVSEWHTIVVTGLRQGGPFYFALEVTDPQNPQFLWEFTDSNLAESWSEMAIGKVRVKIGGRVRERWVGMFGGGFSKAPVRVDSRGKAFYVVNLADGSILWAMRYNDGKTGSNRLLYGIPSSPTVVDTNGDGFLDLAYVGDLGGQLWKFDFSDPDPGNWSGTVIFHTTPARLIYYAPAVTVDPEGNWWVFFGTGDRDDPQNLTERNRFYGIKDLGPPERTDRDLVEAGPNVRPEDDGWYIDLEQGEKVLAPPEVVAGKVFFTTYRPIPSDNPCEVSGEAKLYEVNYLTGAQEAEPVDLGSGVPTNPQLSFSETGHPILTVGTTSGRVYMTEIPLPFSFKKVIYWREVRE